MRECEVRMWVGVARTVVVVVMVLSRSFSSFLLNLCVLLRSLNVCKLKKQAYLLHSFEILPIAVVLRKHPFLDLFIYSSTFCVAPVCLRSQLRIVTQT